MQRVLDRDARHLGLVDAGVELLDLPQGELLPVARLVWRASINWPISSSENPTSRRNRTAPTTPTASGG